LRYDDAQCFRSLEVDEHLDFRGSLDRQVSGLLAGQDPAGVDAGEMIGFGDAAAVAD
jgi:hypothetical protein